ncbi:MAG: hydrogenase [Acinetobacter sp.]|nr:hydrogenase [Acinetobacter sp.]
MNIILLRHAFVLILLSLIGGLLIPAMNIPRLGLSAHTIGVLGSVLLLAIGAIWQHFQLSPTQSTWLKWSWLYSSYINWLACMLGGFLGAGKMTPIAAAGYIGNSTVEILVAMLFISVGIASFVAVGLSLWGLRRSE